MPLNIHQVCLMSAVSTRDNVSLKVFLEGAPPRIYLPRRIQIIQLYFGGQLFLDGESDRCKIEVIDLKAIE